MKPFSILAATTAVALSLAVSVTAQVQVSDGQFPVQSNLRAGVAKVDITPTKVAGIETVGHRRIVSGLRDPLRAGVLLLDDGETKAAIVTMDLINVYDLMVRLVREEVETTTGVPAANIMVTASHNHSGPPCRDDSPYVREVAQKIGAAAKQAAANMRSVNVGYGEDEIRFNINRRKVIDGRAVVWLNSDGPNDPRVKVLRFDDGRSLTPMAVLMHAVCHPCFFTWGDKGSQPFAKGYPKMSADFPGDAQTFVELNYRNQTSALFLQGCAGDIRPNLPGFPYRCADEADMQWAGRGLGSAVVRSLSDGVRREKLRKRPTYYPIRVASEVVTLPGKEGDVSAELMAMKIGPFLFLTMPGEPMVEYGFAIEKAIGPRAQPIIVGYANGAIGYIATTESYSVGGYEPKASPLVPEAQPIVIRELGKLADKVIGDVFESFSKHPKDVKKREAEEKAPLDKSATN
jgi:neutral ceramidase